MTSNLHTDTSLNKLLHLLGLVIHLWVQVTLTEEKIQNFSEMRIDIVKDCIYSITYGAQSLFFPIKYKVSTFSVNSYTHSLEECQGTRLSLNLGWKVLVGLFRQCLDCPWIKQLHSYLHIKTPFFQRCRNIANHLWSYVQALWDLH